MIKPSPRYSIISARLCGFSVSSGASNVPWKAFILLAIKVGISMQIKEGKMRCSISFKVVTLSPIHSIVVVTSPMGDHAPPALAVIIIIPTYQILSSLSLISFVKIEINTMVAVKLSIIADRIKARIATIQSNVFLLLVRMNFLMVENPSK